ncbi:MAG TPA: hypothetical protein VGP72_29140 [Planctomycetota bacterium]|jgi:hypothetical protein
MERKKWLTMVYREANIFLEHHAPEDTTLTPTEVDELEPELSQQVQEILSNVDYLEDIIKFSLLKNPPPDLWYGEGNWQHVLVAVASTCLTFDVKGVVLKILEGELPRTPSQTLLDPL